MVVENQRRWDGSLLARQWGNWAERGVILNAVGMLRELQKNGNWVVTLQTFQTMQVADSVSFLNQSLARPIRRPRHKTLSQDCLKALTLLTQSAGAPLSIGSDVHTHYTAIQRYTGKQLNRNQPATSVHASAADNVKRNLQVNVVRTVRTSFHSRKTLRTTTTRHDVRQAQPGL